MIGPLFLRPIAIQLHTVAIRIVEVDRFRYTVIAGSRNGVILIDQSLNGSRKIFTGWVENSGVKESSVPFRSRRSSFTLPGIEPDVMMIASYDNCALNRSFSVCCQRLAMRNAIDAKNTVIYIKNTLVMSIDNNLCASRSLSRLGRPESIKSIKIPIDFIIKKNKPIKMSA